MSIFDLVFYMSYMIPETLRQSRLGPLEMVFSPFPAISNHTPNSYEGIFAVNVGFHGNVQIILLFF